jgi:methylated-DNA-protein-cysteine methyltransferase-like protein
MPRQPKTELPSSGKDNFSFYADVYDVVRQIPRGRVSSYGAIARFLGTGSSARLVGWAMNASHLVKPPVPAHRVVNRNGMLSGKMHFATPDTMQQLLEKEKVKVEKDQVVDFDKLFWDPSEALEL